MGLFDFMEVVLKLSPGIAIFMLSLFVALLTTLIYKYTTNQKLLKQLKDEIKGMQTEMKSSKEPGKAAHMQKEIMKRTMQQFTASTKSMLITLLPLILLFGWMQAHFSYDSVKPGGEFTTTVTFAPGASGNVTLNVEGGDEGLKVLSDAVQEAGAVGVWRLKAEDKGVYLLKYSFGDELYTREVIVSDELRYAPPVLTKGAGSGRIKEASMIERISVGLPQLKPLGGISLLGWQPGWLGSYIMFSLLLSLLVRKWLKVH